MALLSSNIRRRPLAADATCSSKQKGKPSQNITLPTPTCRIQFPPIKPMVESVKKESLKASPVTEESPGILDYIGIAIGALFLGLLVLILYLICDGENPHKLTPPPPAPPSSQSPAKNSHSGSLRKEEPQTIDELDEEPIGRGEIIFLERFPKLDEKADELLEKADKLLEKAGDLDLYYQANRAETLIKKKEMLKERLDTLVERENCLSRLRKYAPDYPDIVPKIASASEDTQEAEKDLIQAEKDLAQAEIRARLNWLDLAQAKEKSPSPKATSPSGIKPAAPQAKQLPEREANQVNVPLPPSPASSPQAEKTLVTPAIQAKKMKITFFPPISETQLRYRASDGSIVKTSRREPKKSPLDSNPALAKAVYYSTHPSSQSI